MAVGGYTNNGTQVTLSEQWQGAVANGPLGSAATGSPVGRPYWPTLPSMHSRNRSA